MIYYWQEARQVFAEFQRSTASEQKQKAIQILESNDMRELGILWLIEDEIDSNIVAILEYLLKFFYDSSIEYIKGAFSITLLLIGVQICFLILIISLMILLYIRNFNNEYKRISALMSMVPNNMIARIAKMKGNVLKNGIKL